MRVKDIDSLGDGSRESAARALAEGRSTFGVVTYRDDLPVESYPVDPQGRRMDLTMAFVGTRAMFENCGFEVVGETGAVASKLPRLVMRRMLAD